MTENFTRNGFNPRTYAPSLMKNAGAFRLPEDDTDPLELQYTIRRKGNHIFIYDVINDDTQLLIESFIRDAINESVAEHAQELAKNQFDESIVLHINSPGGYLNSGLFLYDFLKISSKSMPINCVIEGNCASAATLIFLGGKNRIMSFNSSFLMHELAYGGEGKNTYMQDMAINAEKAMDKLIKIYEKETDVCKYGNITDKKGVPVELTSEERYTALRELLKHDFEFGYDDCLKNRIITEECEVPEDEEEIDVELTEEDMIEIQKQISKVAQKRLKLNEEAERKAKGILKSPKAPKNPPAKKAPPKKTPAKKTDVPKKEKSQKKNLINSTFGINNMI